MLNRLILKLDKRLAAQKETTEYTGFKQKERVSRLLSVPSVPKNAPAWAVETADGSEISNRNTNTLFITQLKYSQCHHVLFIHLRKMHLVKALPYGLLEFQFDLRTVLCTELQSTPVRKILPKPDT